MANNSTVDVLPEDGDYFVSYGDVDVYTDLLFNLILIPLFIMLGIVGNIISITVLYHQGFKETSTIFLLSLSVSDFFFCLTQISHPINLVSRWMMGIQSNNVTSVLNVYILIFRFVFLGASIWHVTAISVERCVAVCFPFHVTRVFTPKRAKILSVTLYLFSLAVLSPNFYCYIIIEVPLHNGTLSAIIIQDQCLQSFFNVITYNYIFFNNICTVVPPIIIFTSSVIIGATLITRRHQFLHGNLASKQTRETKVIKMLLTLCVLYLVMCIPTAVLDFYAITVDESAWFRTLKDAVNELLYQLGASYNFIIYLTMSSKFVKTFKNLSFVCVFKRPS